MAGIDHEVIIFKNGKYVRRVSEYDLKTDRFRTLVNIPFEYSRDGEIRGFDFDRCKDKIKYWNGVCETRIIDKFESENMFVWVLHTPTFNVSLYMDGNDVYVILGGYGHYDNPYTHFINRGFGDDFELKMLYECYTWLCERVLPDNIFGASRWDDDCEYNNKLCHTSYFDLQQDIRSDHRDLKIEYYQNADEISEWESEQNWQYHRR